MKVSVSLPDEDVESLVAYADERGSSPRSRVLDKAVHPARAVEFSDDYASAWQDWRGSGDDSLWNSRLLVAGEE